jgi:hypothetical protein
MKHFAIATTYHNLGVTGIVKDNLDYLKLRWPDKHAELSTLDIGDTITIMIGDTGMIDTTITRLADYDGPTHSAN